MDRAGADHDQQTIVVAMEDALNRVTGVVDGVGRCLREGIFVMQLARRANFGDVADAQIVGTVHE